MAKYDVFLNPAGPGYLLDVQADLLEMLNTRVVVPLMPRVDAPKPATRLNPVFEIEGSEVVMVTQFLASVPRSILNGRVGRLHEEADQITAALDMLTLGF